MRTHKTPQKPMIGYKFATNICQITSKKKDAALAAPFLKIASPYSFNNFPLLIWVSVANSNKYNPEANLERSIF
jgi:hypothetical protein